MDIREKMVELVETNPFIIRPRNGGGQEAADWFLANGVTVQERGEWVYDHWCEFKCSVCGEFSNSKPYKGKENYCPNCGAKMMPQPPKGE